MKNLLLTLTLIMALSVNVQAISTKVVTIKPYMSLQHYEHFKRMVLNSDDIHIEFISDFDFEWGYDYKLKIQVKRLVPALSDGTRYEHKLIKVISKTKASPETTFKLYIDPMRYNYFEKRDSAMNYTLSQINDSTYRYCEKVDLEVPAQFRPAFKKLTNSENGRNATFKFTAEGRARLVKFG